MSVRITQNTITNNFMTDVQSVYERLAKAQEQINSGNRINRPSDDPYGTAQVIDYDRQLAELRLHQDNVASTREIVDSGDAALDTAGSALLRVKELLTKAQNGSHSTADLQNISAEILQLKEVVRDSLNAQHGGIYVFAGTSGTTQPFPAPANAYAASANQMSRVVAPGQSVNLAAVGTAVAGPNGTNILDTFDAIAAAVSANSATGMITAANNLATGTQQMLDVRTQYGAMASRLEAITDRLTLTEERLIEARSTIAEVDTTEAFMEFSKQQTMYQAALSAGTRMMQTSILDYL